MSMLFLYDIEFTRRANPFRRKDEFEDSLKGFLRAAGLRFVMGALGGTLHTYGCVWREVGEVSHPDREAVADFVRRQPIRATARLGDLEEKTEATDFLREITEWIFEVDCPSEEDRTKAAEWHGSISKGARSSGQGHA